jgi:regulator of sigma E protease
MGATTWAPQVGQVAINSPAQVAGILPNDEIIKINDTDIKSWDEIGKTIVSTDGALKFFIKRDGEIIAKTINPQIADSENMFKEKIKKRMIGISPSGKVINLELSFGESITYAYEKTIFASTMIFQGVQKLISGVVPSSEVGGVISIGKVISDASESSIIALFAITALISVNLGVLNLLPIPALDGGHIMFNLYEMITRRKPSDQVFMFLTIMGWVILGSLMLLGIYNDINRIFLNN